MPPSGSLTIVGAGIKTPAQITLEAVHHIKQASKVFYLLNHPDAVAWLKSLHPNTEDLAGFYDQAVDRVEVYERMVDCIVAAVRDGEAVCVVFYGHPNVYVYPTRELMVQAQRQRFSVKVCPGVSAEDCLFADLGVDPARTGCQSYDATDFLIRPRQFDTTAGLILWQVGVVGNLTTQYDKPTPGLKVLQEVLGRYYPPGHVVYMYESAVLPDQPSIVQPAPLAQLDRTRVSTLSTLYVPPMNLQDIDRDMVARLGMSDKYLLDAGT